jgi:hypothetical protein
MECARATPPNCEADLMDYTAVKDLAGPIATITAAVAAAFVAYRLGKSQAESARIQAQVAKRTW